MKNHFIMPYAGNKRIEIEIIYDKIKDKLQKSKTIIKIDSKYYRPSEVETLLGDPSKAKNLLGWNPEETDFESLVKIMTKSDLEVAKNERSIKVSYD